MSELKPEYLPVLTKEQLRAINAEVARVMRLGYGKVTIVVSNGQVQFLETSLSRDIRPAEQV